MPSRAKSNHASILFFGRQASYDYLSLLFVWSWHIRSTITTPCNFSVFVDDHWIGIRAYGSSIVLDTEGFRVRLTF